MVAKRLFLKWPFVQAGGWRLQIEKLYSVVKGRHPVLVASLRFYALSAQATGFSFQFLRFLDADRRKSGCWAS